jgi:hypothetical protein
MPRHVSLVRVTFVILQGSVRVVRAALWSFSLDLDKSLQNDKRDSGNSKKI